MSIAMHGAGHFPATRASRLRAFVRVVRDAIEAHAENRVKNAVPPSRLREMDREMRRCRRLMQGGK
jgi:hypothetical protein